MSTAAPRKCWGRGKASSNVFSVNSRLVEVSELDFTEAGEQGTAKDEEITNPSQPDSPSGGTGSLVAVSPESAHWRQYRQSLLLAWL